MPEANMMVVELAVPLLRGKGRTHYPCKDLVLPDGSLSIIASTLGTRPQDGDVLLIEGQHHRIGDVIDCVVETRSDEKLPSDFDTDGGHG